MSGKTKSDTRLPDNWWEQSSGVMGFRLKPQGKTLRDVIARLDEVKEWGFDAISLGIPYHGGIQYGGLDVMDYFAVDPAVGTMDDLQELVGQCHARGLAVIGAFNLGYSAMEYPPFLKACDDVRNGIDSQEVHWFLWSDTGMEELDRSLVPFFRQDIHGYWHYSERAGKYYWVKWAGADGEENMPQFNFGDPVWQEECKRVMTFWMDTGIDGMVIDAVNWYLNCTWEINNATMTDIVHQYPNKFVQPEGAGGFKDDPVPWITKGKYNCLQDYEVATWWTGRDVIGRAIETGNPVPIEWALRTFRDRVVDAGGVTWLYPSWGRGGGSSPTPEQMLLSAATLATVGELFVGREMMLDLRWPPELLARLRDLIKARQEYPALNAVGSRKKLPTHNDQLFYAFLRTSASGDQEMLVVLNFQRRHRLVRVRMGRPATLTDISTQKRVSVTNRLELSLPPYGYRIYLVER